MSDEKMLISGWLQLTCTLNHEAQLKECELIGFGDGSITLVYQYLVDVYHYTWEISTPGLAYDLNLYKVTKLGHVLHNMKIGMVHSYESSLQNLGTALQIHGSTVVHPSSAFLDLEIPMVLGHGLITYLHHSFSLQGFAVLLFF